MQKIDSLKVKAIKNSKEKKIKPSTIIDDYTLKQLINSFPYPVLLLRRTPQKELLLTGFNQQADDLFAISLSEVLNKDVKIFWPIEYWQDFKSLSLKSAKKAIQGKIDLFVLEKDNRKNIFTLQIFQIAENQVVVLFIDTTAQVQTQQNIIEEKIKYEELYKNTPVMLSTLDQNGTIVDANNHWYLKTEFSRNEVLGKNWTEFMTEESRQKILTSGFDELLMSGHLSNYPIQLIKKNGGILEALVDARALHDIRGRFIKCYTTIHDITPLKELSEEYESSELRYAKLFESAIVPILIYSIEDGIVDCNQKSLELFNKSKEELLGLHLSDLVYTQPKTTKKENFKLKEEMIFSGEVTEFEMTIQPKKNKFFECEVFAGIMQIKNKPLAVLFIRDKTEEVKVARQIQISESKFRTIWDESDEGLKLLDKNGNILMVNKKASKIFGIYEKALTGKNLVTLLDESTSGIYPKKFREFIESNEESEIFDFELSFEKDSKKIIEEKLIKVKIPEYEEKVIYSIWNDITERKAAEEELKASEERFRKLNETKDKFISILSHDLRAPTASIIGMISALFSQPVENSNDLRTYLDLIYSSAKYQLNLISNLLDWSNIESGKEKFSPTQQNLRHIVQESINTIQGIAKNKNVEIISKVNSESVLVDQHLFERLLVNLLSNAIKFSYDGSKIEVFSAPSGINQVEVCVCDYGMGIPQDVQQKLFNLKEKVTRLGTQGERGSGIGLNLCREIVNLHGGKLWIESPHTKIRKQNNNSKMRGGTKVYFTIPKISRKIFISETLFNPQIEQIILNETSDYQIETGDFVSNLSNFLNEYYSLILFDQNTGNTLDSLKVITENYRTNQNLWCVTSNEITEYNELWEGIKIFFKDELENQLGRELQKFFFELQQVEREPQKNSIQST
ncbi:MAG: PAS domain S-box protein [Ignavibacteria bacterium]|nr:PAS domain S-box protein [Ignavibacteria bacterium]